MLPMNAYAIVVLVSIVARFVIWLIADLLNLRALSDELPKEFIGIYNADDYKKSQEYTRARTRLGFVTSTFDLTVILTFWFCRGFNFLDATVRSWNWPLIPTGMVYIGILVAAKSVLSLPFDIYSTFVIEERFGFNRTTVATYITDLAKTAVLGVLLGAPLVAGILALFQYAGAASWLYCWLATALFVLFVQFIAPNWIMPLFNKFVPLAEGELRQAILSYARSVDFSLENVYVMDGSRRSSKANAFFTGFGRNKRIALFDTLIAKHSVAGLVAVLAHEIGHYKKKHVLQGLVLAILHAGVLFYILSFFIRQRGLFEAFYLDHPSIYAGLVIFGLLYAPVEMILSVLLHMRSRRNEYEADRFAARTTSDPDSLIQALKLLSRDHLSNLTPHALGVFLDYSHPPILERIEALRLQNQGS